MESERGVSTVQYRIIVGRKDEWVEGPDEADVVITVPLADVTADGFDPAVAYMQGKPSTGSTGELFRLLRSGAASEALSAPRITSLSSA